MGVDGLEAEHGEGFRGSVADGLADPADELDAALGGPPGAQNQGRDGAAGRRTLPGQSADPFGSALLLGLVADAVLPFQGVLVEQEQIVGNPGQLGLRLLGHQAGGQGFLLPVRSAVSIHGLKGARPIEDQETPLPRPFGRLRLNPLCTEVQEHQPLRS